MLKIERDRSLCDECTSPQKDHPATWQEGELLLRARQGDGAAFGALCERYSTRILRALRRILRNKEDAEDALQEAMLKAFLHLSQFDERSRFSTWFTSIAVNAALMILRKNRVRHSVPIAVSGAVCTDEVSVEIADCAPAIDTTFALNERIAILRKAVSEMRPSLQVVLEFHDLRECSGKETALAVGISIPAAKARLSRARIQLRRRLSLSQ